MTGSTTTTVGTSVLGGQEPMPTVVRTLEDIRDAIDTFQEQGQTAFLEVGRLLLEAKAKFAEQGKWLEWLTKNTSFTARSAQRLMRIASYFAGDATPVSQLGVSKAYILCRLPPKDLDRFLECLHHVDGPRPMPAADMTKRQLEQAVSRYLDQKRRESTSSRSTKNASVSTVQDRIKRLQAELSAVSQLIADTNGRSTLNEETTTKLCNLCSAIIQQFSPDPPDELCG